MTVKRKEFASGAINLFFLKKNICIGLIFSGAFRAVAEYNSRDSGISYTPDDVIITAGCTQAIEFSIAALRRRGSNILLPRPGFPLYATFCSYLGVNVRYYDLLPEQGWEIDLEMVERIADKNTIAILICNPSNPCGVAYSHDHLSKVCFCSLYIDKILFCLSVPSKQLIYFQYACIHSYENHFERCF